MEVVFTKRFLKDLASIPSKQRKEIEDFVFERISQVSNFTELKVFEKMSGYDDCYKARFGSYRVGAIIQDNVIELKRVMNRKDIYKYFP